MHPTDLKKIDYLSEVSLDLVFSPKDLILSGWNFTTKTLAKCSQLKWYVYYTPIKCCVRFYTAL